MRFAEQGYNRDVVFGVLIGRDCETQKAARIADSVLALHASRQPAPEPVAAAVDEAEPAVTPSPSDDDHAHKAFGNPLGALWYQFLNGLKL